MNDVEKIPQYSDLLRFGRVEQISIKAEKINKIFSELESKSEIKFVRPLEKPLSSKSLNKLFDRIFTAKNEMHSSIEKLSSFSNITSDYTKAVEPVAFEAERIYRRGIENITDDQINRQDVRRFWECLDEKQKHAYLAASRINQLRYELSQSTKPSSTLDSKNIFESAKHIEAVLGLSIFDSLRQNVKNILSGNILDSPADFKETAVLALLIAAALDMNPNLKNDGYELTKSETERFPFVQRELIYWEKIKSIYGEKYSSNSIMNLQQLILQTGDPFLIGDTDASCVKIMRNPGPPATYTIIFPATVGNPVPKFWATNTLNSWGSNVFALNSNSKLSDLAYQSLRNSIIEHGDDPHNTAVQAAGFSQGGILAAGFTQKYGSDLNIEQLVTVGSPTSSFHGIGSKTNVLNLKNVGFKLPLGYDPIAFSDQAIECWAQSLCGYSNFLTPKAVENILISSHIIPKTFSLSGNSNSRDIFVSDINHPVLDASVGSVAPGHDVGNYAFTVDEGAVDGTNLKHFFTDNAEVERHFYQSK